MAHRKDVFRYGPDERYIDYEYKFKGKYGKKGEKRVPRKKATPEQMKKQNQYNREKLVIRKIRENFTDGDIWATLKFPRGTRISGSDLKKSLGKLFDRLRYRYKKAGKPLKYMYRAEIGERGGVHVHILVSRIGETDTMQILQEQWNLLTGGRIHAEPIYREGEYKNLAEYLVKPINAEISGQLTLFGTEEERKLFSSYGCSRNLVVPEKETHVYTKRTVEKLIKDGPKPTPGYYIDRDSIRYGVNPYTGMSYFYYTEIKLDGSSAGKKGGSSG